MIPWRNNSCLTFVQKQAACEKSCTIFWCKFNFSCGILKYLVIKNANQTGHSWRFKDQGQIQAEHGTFSWKELDITINSRAPQAGQDLVLPESRSCEFCEPTKDFVLSQYKRNKIRSLKYFTEKSYSGKFCSPYIFIFTLSLTVC